MRFDKKGIGAVFLGCIVAVACVGILVFGVVLFWAATGNAKFYAIESLPCLENAPVMSAVVGFLVYLVGLVCAARELQRYHRGVKTENGI